MSLFCSNVAQNLKQLKYKHNIEDARLSEPNDPAVKAQQLFTSLTEYWTGLSRKMATMSEKVKELNEKWAKEPIVMSDMNMSTALTRSRYYCQKIKESWQTLHKDKANRILSMNEEQLHQLEKIKIENNCKKISKLLCNVCYTALAEITEKLEDWYTGAQVAIVQSDCLFKELAIFMNDCDQLQQCLNLVREQERRSWATLLDGNVASATNGVAARDKIAPSVTASTISQIVADKPSFTDSVLTSDVIRSLPPQLANELSLLREAHSKLWTALEENQAVINEFESLSVDGGHAV